MSNEQRIYIGPQEDLTNVCERLEGIPTRRVTLVIPSQTLLRSFIAWRNLYAYAQKLRKEVFIISSNPQIRSMARAAKLKVTFLESYSPSKTRSSSRIRLRGTGTQRSTGGSPSRQSDQFPLRKPPAQQTPKSKVVPAEDTPQAVEAKPRQAFSIFLNLLLGTLGVTILLEYLIELNSDHLNLNDELPLLIASILFILFIFLNIFTKSIYVYKQFDKLELPIEKIDISIIGTLGIISILAYLLRFSSYVNELSIHTKLLITIVLYILSFCYIILSWQDDFGILSKIIFHIVGVLGISFIVYQIGFLIDWIFYVISIKNVYFIISMQFVTFCVISFMGYLYLQMLWRHLET